MRVANCKTVCREIDESNVGQDLSQSARDHVQGCQHCRAFYDDRHKLRSMLADLETVEVPPDFDFRVRARLVNHTAGAHTGIFFGGRSFGVPAVALASLVLLLGVGFALRTLMSTSNSDTTHSTAVPAQESNLVDKQRTPAESLKVTQTQPNDRIEIGGHETFSPVVEPQRRVRRSNNTVAVLRTNGRLATREFSSTAASVVKQDQAIASLESSPVFAVEASAEPLKVSLDYDTGVSRTISLPALSFGSQRALTGDAASVVKTSAKGVW